MDGRNEKNGQKCNECCKFCNKKSSAFEVQKSCKIDKICIRRKLAHFCALMSRRKEKLSNYISSAVWLNQLRRQQLSSRMEGSSRTSSSFFSRGNFRPDFLLILQEGAQNMRRKYANFARIFGNVCCKFYKRCGATVRFRHVNLVTSISLQGFF